VVEVLL
jgi:hypothetical protein